MAERKRSWLKTLVVAAAIYAPFALLLSRLPGALMALGTVVLAPALIAVAWRATRPKPVAPDPT